MVIAVRSRGGALASNSRQAKACTHHLHLANHCFDGVLINVSGLIQLPDEWGVQ